MPEGPEVKKTTDMISKFLKNKKLKKININSGRYKKKLPKGFNTFINQLPLTVKSINCYGKFIWWEFLDSEYTLWNTLGMSGVWTFMDGEKHNNITFEFSDHHIYFNDYRNFGTLIFCTKDNLEKKLSKFGPDILDISNKNKSLEHFKKKIDKKRNDTFIASALLDQGVAAGCGNYIRAEVLYMAKISPYRRLDKLTEKEIKLIWNLLQQVGMYYYNKKLGNSSGVIDGTFKFANYYKQTFLIYMQDRDPKGNIISREKIKDRTIHYVKKIQK